MLLMAPWADPNKPYTTRNSTKINGLTDEIFLSGIYGNIYRRM